MKVFFFDVKTSKMTGTLMFDQEGKIIYKLPYAYGDEVECVVITKIN